MKRAILTATTALLIGAPVLSTAQEFHRGPEAGAFTAPARSSQQASRTHAVFQGAAYSGASGDVGLIQISQPRSGGQRFAFAGKSFFRYPAAPYRYPVGFYNWTNHVWRRGEWVPPVFISAAYFVNDWSAFGLWRPAYGYEWVRIGSDVLLVNLADGQVVDVVPGVYYD